MERNMILQQKYQSRTRFEGFVSQIFLNEALFTDRILFDDTVGSNAYDEAPITCIRD